MAEFLGTPQLADLGEFKKSIVASTDCRLAHAEDCRNYWTMDDDDDWGDDDASAASGGETE